MSTDIDDSIVFADLLRSGEVSRLRRRGAMRIHDRHDHFDDMPAFESVSNTSDEEWESESDGRSARWTDAFPCAPTTTPLFCGTTCSRSVLTLPVLPPFKPSPIPWSPPSTHQSPSLRTFTGCGASVCSSAIHYRSAYISTWQQDAVPVDLSYIPPEVFDRKEPIESRYIRSECGCFRTGLSCACCGNAIGIVYNPCPSARSRLDLDSVVHRRFTTLYVFFPTSVTPSTPPSSSPTSPPSDLFTLHLPQSPLPRAPFASTLGQNNTPRPLTPPRPRQRDLDNEYELSWGDMRAQAERTHFSFPNSQADSVPVDNHSSAVESGETTSDPLAWARSYLGGLPARPVRVEDEEDEDEVTPFIPPPRRRNAFLTAASTVNSESRPDASFDPNRWLLDRESMMTSPLATFGELAGEDEDEDDDLPRPGFRPGTPPVRVSIMAGPGPSELASPPQESPPPFVWGPNPFVRSTPYSVPIEIGSSEADLIGYDVGEEVILGLRRVTVDAAGEFLAVDKDFGDDEKEGSAQTTPRLQGC